MSAGLKEQLSPDLGSATARLESWCREAALPFWAENGLDPKGGFFERLYPDGSPDRDAVRRVRVQCRIIYTYAHAHYLGWYDRSKDVADHVTAWLLDNALVPDLSIAEGAFSGCAFTLHPDGTVQDSKRDTYTLTFLLLAMAWRYRAFGDSSALKIAGQTLAFMDGHLAANNGGYLEAQPGELPRRQNPHMHLFEALMALYEATGNSDYLDRAGAVLTLFEQHFFDHDTHLMTEFFHKDWSPCDQAGKRCEPGHMAEWSWLIRQYARLAGADGKSPYPDLLYHAAATKGRDSASGFLLDEISRSCSYRKTTKRLWPQTEYVKAALSIFRQTGNTVHGEAAAVLINRLFETYFHHPLNGAWYDSLDEENRPVPGKIQPSTFYHIFSMAAQAAE